MTECMCQLCGKWKKVEAWSPKDEMATFRVIGIKGSSLPICYDCILEKTRDPQYFIATLEEFLRDLKEHGYKVESKDENNNAL